MTLNPFKALRERRAKKEEKQHQELVESAQRLRELYKPYAAAEKYLNTLTLFAGSKAEYEGLWECKGFEYLGIPGPMKQVFFMYEEDKGRAWGLDPNIAGILKAANVVALVDMQYVGDKICSGPRNVSKYMGRPVRPKTLDERI